MKRPVKRNALLAKPPRQYHYLTRQRVDPKLYEGVHVTNDFALAASYAIGTWTQVRRTSEDAYPVVLSLDVTGLDWLPDVDALIQGQAAFDHGTALDLASELKKGVSLGELPDRWRWGGVESECSIGDDPSCFVIENAHHYNVARAFLEYYDDEDMATDAVLRWAATSKYDERILSMLVNQRRYMGDIGLKRLVAIEAVQPWWSEVLDIYDDDSEKKADIIESAGWKVVSLDDITPDFRRDERKTLFEQAVGEKRDVAYHGTVSENVREAFPEVALPDQPPFPVSEPDFDEHEEDGHA